jgi:predicted DNA-binding transcriptional regulator AlpA
VQVCVELPPGPLIEYSAFCKAIAEAVCPVRIEGLKGIECVVGKVVGHQMVMDPATGTLDRTLRAGFQSVLLSEGGHTLDQLVADQRNGVEATASELPLGKQIVEFSLPYLLDESDRRALEAVLPLLPPLSYPMSTEAAEAFLDAYYRLPGHPAWEPDLMSAAYIERRRGEQMYAMERHQRELREAFAAGRLVAVDCHHGHVKELISGTFIPREDAIAYMQDRRLAYVDSGTDAVVAHSKESVQPESKATPAAMPQTLDAVEQGVPIEAALRGQERRSDVPPSTSVGGHASPPKSDVVIRKIGKIARLDRVIERTGLSRSSIYNRMDERSPQYDATFPRNFPLGPMEGSAVGWDENEIDAWVAAQAERVGQPRPRRKKRPVAE